jgi:Co/Zn/Cd efflux system component
MQGSGAGSGGRIELSQSTAGRGSVRFVAGYGSGMTGSSTGGPQHRHGHVVHNHPYARPHRHLWPPRRSEPLAVRHGQSDHHEHVHDHGNSHDEHGHSHGLVDRSIVRSREGVKAVTISLAVLGIAAGAQVAIFVLSGSVALLADLIHNFGDALTAVPLGLAVVLAILVSACVALYETIMRLVHPQHITHLWILGAAGVIGFVGNELAAQVRLRAGKRLASPALIADGNHARIDGFVSLGVVASAVVVALGARVGDPLVGLLITFVILKITWDSWRTVSHTDPGEMIDP